MTARQVPLAELGSLDGELVAIAAERPRPAGEEEGQEALDVGLPTGPLRVAAYAGSEEVLVSQAETAAALALARGGRPVVAHDWKTIATSDGPFESPPLEHDTMVAAYLIDPAGRAYPLGELCDQEDLARASTGPTAWPSAP